jgi:hypothetical protein
VNAASGSQGAQDVQPQFVVTASKVLHEGVPGGVALRCSIGA